MSVRKVCVGRGDDDGGVGTLMVAVVVLRTTLCLVGYWDSGISLIFSDGKEQMVVCHNINI